MAPAPVYLTSDVHLGAIPRERVRSFLRWLDRAGSDASEVVVNGDLFDFWFEYGHVVPRGHTRVLGALAALVDAGVGVRLVGGNHDWWGGSYLEEEIGATFHREPAVVELAGRRVLLAHGDGLGRGDLGYRLLKLILRGRFTRWAFRWLHPDLGARIARRVSHTEASVTEAPGVRKARAEVLEAWAVETLEERPDLDAVALGHTHVPRLRRVGDDRWYVNSGDWVLNRSYVVLAPGEDPRLLEWEDG